MSILKKYAATRERIQLQELDRLKKKAAKERSARRLRDAMLQERKNIEMARSDVSRRRAKTMKKISSGFKSFEKSFAQPKKNKKKNKKNDIFDLGF